MKYCITKQLSYSKPIQVITVLEEHLMIVMSPHGTNSPLYYWVNSHFTKTHGEISQHLYTAHEQTSSGWGVVSDMHDMLLWGLSDLYNILQTRS